MPEKEPRQLHFELDFALARIENASCTVSPAGEELSYSIVDLSDEQMAGLEHAAKGRSSILLVFASSRIEMDLVSLERRGPRFVKIVGHLVGVTPRR